MTSANGKTYPNLIGGVWKTSSSSLLENRNPADYNEIIGLFPMATVEETASAIEHARSALSSWSQTPAPERGAILDRASQILSTRLDEIATMLTREEGKTLAEAKGEVARARDILSIMQVKAGAMAVKFSPVPSTMNYFTRVVNLWA